MTFFGPPTVVEKVGQPDVLEFRIAPVLRGLHLAVVALFVGVFVGVIAGSVFGPLSGFVVGPIVGACGAAAFYAAKHNDHRERVLRVTDTRLEATGRDEPLTYPWSKVIELAHHNGGEDEPSGLAVRTGRWSWKVIVKDVPNDEAQWMVRAIFRKFPNVKMAPEPPGLLESWLGFKKKTEF